MPKLIGNKIIVKSEEDLLDLETRLAHVQMEYRAFVIDTLVELINYFIVQKIKRKMEDRNFSQRIIDKVRLDEGARKQGDKIKFWILSDAHSSNGFPVAEMMENGRRAYFVKPRYKQALRFYLAGIKQPNMTIKGDVPVYSKGHMIPALKAYKIVYNTVRQRQPMVQRAFTKRQRQWYREAIRKR